MSLIPRVHYRWHHAFSLIESLIALMLLISVTALVVSAFSGIARKVTKALEAQEEYRNLMEAYGVVQGYAHRACPPFWLKDKPAAEIAGTAVLLHYLDGIENEEERVRIVWNENAVEVWKGEVKEKEMPVPAYEVVMRMEPNGLKKARRNFRSSQSRGFRSGVSGAGVSKGGIVVELRRGDTMLPLFVGLPCYSVFHGTE